MAVAQPGDNAVSVMKRADEAMYASKRAGRNRAHLHDGGRCLALDEPGQAAQDAGDPAARSMPQEPPSLDTKGLDPEAIRDQLRRRLREAVEIDRTDSPLVPPPPGGSP